MSTLHHEDLLLTIFEEVQEAFPYLDEDKQIEIANNRFWDLAQWPLKKKYKILRTLLLWINHLKSGWQLAQENTSGK